MRLLCRKMIIGRDSIDVYVGMVGKRKLQNIHTGPNNQRLLFRSYYEKDCRKIILCDGSMQWHDPYKAPGNYTSFYNLMTRYHSWRDVITCRSHNIYIEIFISITLIYSYCRSYYTEVFSVTAGHRMAAMYVCMYVLDFNV